MWARGRMAGDQRKGSNAPKVHEKAQAGSRPHFAFYGARVNGLAGGAKFGHISSTCTLGFVCLLLIASPPPTKGRTRSFMRTSQASSIKADLAGPHSSLPCLSFHIVNEMSLHTIVNEANCLE